MTKYFCDVCGKEIETNNSSEIYKVVICNKSPSRPRKETIYEDVCECCSHKLKVLLIHYNSLKENRTNGQIFDKKGR